MCDTYARDRFLRGVEPTVGSPSAALRRYRSVIHVPRPLIALLALASVVGVACALRWRREVLLFSGSGILLLLGTAATAGFAQRYLLCAVPPLAIGGTLSLRGARQQHSHESTWGPSSHRDGGASDRTRSGGRGVPRSLGKPMIEQRVILTEDLTKDYGS